MLARHVLVFAFLAAGLNLSPLLLLLFESFRGPAGGFTLAHLATLSLSARQLGLLGNSLLLASGSTVGSLLVGVPLAFLVSRTDLRGRAFFHAAALVPLVIPPYIQALVWVKIARGAGGAPWFPVHGTPGGILVFTLSFFPIVTAIVASGLRSLDRSLEEASLLAHGALRTVRGITLPLVAPHVGAGAILVFVLTLVNFEAADILRLKVFPVEIFINFSALYDEGAATVLSLPLVAAALLLIGVQTRFMRGKSYAAPVVNGSGGLFPLGRHLPWALTFAAVVTLLSTAAPLLVLLHGAGPPGNYLKALAASRAEIAYSLTAAAASALVMTGLAFAVSYALVRDEGPRRQALDFLTQCTFGVPSVVLGIGLIRVWNQPGFAWIHGTSLLLVVGYVAAYCPFVIRIVAARLLQTPREIEESALLATENQWLIVRRILLPMSLPGLAAGFLAGFVLALSNLGTALLVVAPGRATLPIKIYNLMHYGADELVFASSVLLLLMIAAAIALAWPAYVFLSRRSGS